MPCKDRDENSPAQGEEELAANLRISAQFIWNCAWHGARNRDVAKIQVICAWCRHEGKPGYLGEREPFDNPAPTHGVCLRHREQFLESLPSTSFPDAELLIVVRGGGAGACPPAPPAVLTSLAHPRRP